jgi:hypothetical protein
MTLVESSLGPLLLTFKLFGLPISGTIFKIKS